jgi:hypothetical protein
MRTKSLDRRALQVVAVLAALVGGGSVIAQTPPAPLPVTEPTTPAQEPIEIYYGTRKVSPVPVNSPEQPVVQASAVGNARNPERLYSTESISEVVHVVCDGMRDVSKAMGGFVSTVGGRDKHDTEPRQVVFPNVTMPALSTASPQPQVVVIREPAESRPAPESAYGMTLNVPTLIAFGVGFLGLVFSIKAWSSSARKTEHAMVPVFQTAKGPVVLDPNSVNLMGRYNAGPKPDTAEKFEIGPTYHEQLQHKKNLEEASNSAAVELILNQNLALLAAMNPGEATTVVHTDDEGYALPADTHHVTPAMA